MRDLVIQPKDDPNAPTFTVTQAHVKQFSEAMRAHYAEHEGTEKAATINRNNSYFIKVNAAVEVLDEKGFDYGKRLEPAEKFWFVVFAARMLRRLRGNPRHAPMYVEVF
jgi:hypothetical protein